MEAAQTAKTEAERQVSDAQAALDAAKKAAWDTPEVKAAQAKLDEANAALDQAKAMLKDAQDAYREASEAVSQREREVTAAKAALAALLADRDHAGTTNGSTSANGSTGTASGAHGGSTVIGAANKTSGATGNATVADNTVASAPESVQAVERAAQLASTGSDVTALAVAGVMAMLMGAGVMATAKRRS